MDKIAFGSNRSGTGQIHLMNADGSNQIQLTETFDGAGHAVWSPDGSRIAFIGVIGDAHNLYTIGVDGCNQVKVTNDFKEMNPRYCWSPDGSKLAFIGAKNYPEESKLYVANADGSHVGLILDLAPGEYCSQEIIEEYPINVDWSSDGTKILCAFYNNTCGARICTISPDGTDLNYITEELGDCNASWSPDDTKILTTNDDGCIIIMNADGSDREIVTTFTSENPYNYVMPASWSPDASKISYLDVDESATERILSIFVINSDGSGKINLTAEITQNAYDGSWSPDGLKIAYSTDDEIYTMNAADGSGKTKLTNNDSPDYSSAWQPRMANEY